MLAAPDFTSEVHTQFISEEGEAVLVVPHRHHQFLLDVSLG